MAARAESGIRPLQHQGTGPPSMAPGETGVRNEGKTHVSAQYAAPQKDPRLPGAHEHQERPFGSQAPPSEGPQTADGLERLRFLSAEHIRRRADFELIYKRGAKVQGRYTTVFLLANDKGVGRLGIAATRKLGGSVERNRAKRLIREVFRRNKIAPGFDVVVVPRRVLLDASLTVLEAEYRDLVERRLRRAR
jgi:ribonuclease P protein component